MTTTMRRISRLALTCLALVLSAGAAAAQETPEAVALRYFESMRANDLAANAALMDPEALASLKRTFTPLVELDTQGEVMRMLFGVGSRAEYDALAPAALYQRFLTTVMNLQPDMRAVMAGSTAQVIGRVDEGADTSHVVYRIGMEIEGARMSKIETISLRRTPAGWRTMLSADVENFVSALMRQQAEASQ